MEDLACPNLQLAPAIFAFVGDFTALGVWDCCAAPSIRIG
jgi:hypothetical protein